LPRMNGYEVAKKIREQPDGASMVLIALSGYGQEEDKRRANEAGFNRHLTKPVDSDVLEALLNDLANVLQSKATK
jgi:CheY-like chemotaxis protein